mgnify:FL=1
MQIDPMTFSEFLIANGDENLALYLESVDAIEPISDAFFNPLYEKLKMYCVTGGMPESVLMWVCSAVWHSWLPQPLGREIACLSSLKVH